MPRSLQRNSRPIEDFVSRFGAQLHAVSACRRDFVGWMRGADVDGAVVDDLEVVFSELVANAVAASGSTTDDIGVRARLDGDVLGLEVSNHTDGPRAVELPAVPGRQDMLRPQGRGLLIARSLVDSVHMETKPPDLFLVRCYRRLSSRR